MLERMNSVNETQMNENKSALYEEFIVDDDFSYEGYQVVRGEFFAHINEPSITFNMNKVSVNKAAITKLPNVDYVLFLVNSEQKTLVLRPCEEDTKDSYRWARLNKSAKRVPKQSTCTIFFGMLTDLMGWEPQNRYKILGKMIKSNGECLLVFDLKNAEVYRRIIEEGQKPKASRRPIYPAEWQTSFGLSVEEHQKAMQINIFDGYAVIEVNKPGGSNANES